MCLQGIATIRPVTSPLADLAGDYLINEEVVYRLNRAVQASLSSPETLVFLNGSSSTRPCWGFTRRPKLWELFSLSLT